MKRTRPVRASEFFPYPPLRGTFVAVAVVNGKVGPPRKLVLSGVTKEEIVLPKE